MKSKMFLSIPQYFKLRSTPYELLDVISASFLPERLMLLRVVVAPSNACNSFCAISGYRESRRLMKSFFLLSSIPRSSNRVGEMETDVRL